MATANLTAERLRELVSYDAETGVFTLRQRRRQFPAGYILGYDKEGYRSFRVDGVHRPSHQMAWLYVHGVMPSGVIDHIDGDKANNRIANLRDIPPAVNIQNQRLPQRRNKIGFLGVYKPKRGGYIAQLTVNGRARYLGRFKTPEEAHQAYLTAKRVHHAGCTL